MKLFLIVIVAILFTACSSDPDSSKKNNDNKTRKKITRTTITEQTAPTNNEDLDSANSDLTLISTEEDITELVAENTPNPEATAKDTTEPEQGLISLEEITITPPVSTPSEDIVPLDLTDDQLLVAQINETYNHYLALKNSWENHASQLEIFIDQATNQEFLDSIRYIQSHSTAIPVTPAQIEDVKEQLQKGVFVYQEDRDDAETVYEQLDAFVDLFEASINLSLQYAELAEEDPSVLYAQNPEETTPDEQTAESKKPVVIVVENVQTIPEAIVVQPPKQPVQADDTIQESTNENTAKEDSIADTPVAVVVEKTQEEVIEDDLAIADIPEDTAKEPSDEETVDAQTENPNTDEEIDSAEKTTEIATDTSTDDVDSDTANVEETTEEETSFIDDVVAWWNDIDVGQWFNETFFDTENSAQWVVAPTALSIPNTNTIVPEEENPVVETAEIPSNPVETHQLINAWVDNVYLFAQSYGVNSVEELIPHLAEISNTPEEERTLEQSTLLNQTKQVAQSVEQMSNGDAADFVESSGYSSDQLSKGEVITIVEMLSNFIKVSKEQQEPTVEEEPGKEDEDVVSADELRS